MTDLVIKPSNSGGSVKLQTEGGTNGLTMASTGDLTTSGNVAVTGTVTGGTLGSAVNFPSGHIIQMQFADSTLSARTSTTERAESGTTGLQIASVDITPRATSSKFLVQARAPFNFSRNANYQSASHWIGRGVGSGGVSGSNLSKIYANQLVGYMGTQAGNDIYFDNPIFWLDHNASYSSGQTITYEYRIGSGRGSGTVSFPTLYYNGGSSDYGDGHVGQVMVTEIAG